MRWSLAASLTLHAAILIAALVVLPNPDPHEVKPVEAIQVDITHIGDVSKRMAMTTEAEAPVEKPAPKKTETVQKTDPNAKLAEEVKKAAREPAPPPPSQPEPRKEEPKKEKVKTEEPPPPDPDAMAALLKKTMEDQPPKKEQEPKKAETKPKDKPKPPEKKPEKKPERLDVNQLEAFLNKIDGESTAPLESSALDGAPTRGQANLQGTDNTLSATMIEALVQRVRQCWVVPPGAREAQIVVKVRFRLNQDGTVAGMPEVRNASSDPLFDATARSAVAAVMGCQAYDFLPPEQYDTWKDIIINFNPNMMFDS